MGLDVELRTTKGVVSRITIEHSRHSALAIKWSHILGNRPRWCRQSKSVDLVHEKAVAALESLGVTAEHLSEIAKAGVVEIRFPDEPEFKLWVAESLPWEHWICAATRDESIVIVRHLAVKRKATTRKPKTFSYVESAPGMFRNTENFDAEYDLVSAGLNELELAHIPKDLVEEDLAERIEEAKPDVIHFAGIDNLLGSQLKWEWYKEEMRFWVSVHHGAFFKNTREKYKADLKHQREVEWPKKRKRGKKVDEEKDRLKYEDERKVDAREVAACLNSASRKPLLISFNTWYSNSRLASRCIAEGTGAVLCFHNSIDEQTARRFHFEFYETWSKTGFDLFAAYVAANDKIRPYTDHVKGSAVVLWTSESVVDKKNATRKQILANRTGIKEFYKSQETKSTGLCFADPELDQIDDLVGVTVKLPKFLNYSMLHNGRSLLEKLYLWFRFPNTDSDDHEPNAIRGVEANVMLQIGPDSFPYQARVNLGPGTPQIDLADESLCAEGENPAGGIAVPLISELARKLDEAVQTSIAIDVHWKGQTLYSQTHAITLAPANEWKLDEKDTCWIPSFVQPRSPAVLNIIGSAQKYLRCLSDNINASFMAYQADDVSPQVQAIWSAIAYDYSLSYTEPPPSYRTSSQRLRTPCEIVSERRGTCVDLALLMASCLEWIDIYPVLFLAQKHAFVGYWNSEEAHSDFFKRLPTIRGGEHPFDTKEVGIGTELPWVAGPDVFDEIQKLVHQASESEDDTAKPGALRAMEATFLAKRKGLKESYSDAMLYFSPDSDYYIAPNGNEGSEAKGFSGVFEAMVDITEARKYVTPLPIH